jgi:hypothetical protein
MLETVLLLVLVADTYGVQITVPMVSPVGMVVPPQT